MGLAGRLAPEQADQLIAETQTAASAFSHTLWTTVRERDPERANFDEPDAHALDQPDAASLISPDVPTWRTVLIDLGYLDENATDPTSPILDETFNDAFNRFREELLATPELRPYRDSILARAGDAPTPDMLMAQEALLEHLSELLSLDDTAPAPDRVPDQGEVSVWSRIVQARLARLSLFQEMVGEPYGLSTEMAFAGLFRATTTIPATQITRVQVSAPLVARSGKADALLDLLELRDSNNPNRIPFSVFLAPARQTPRQAFMATLSVDQFGNFSGGSLVRTRLTDSGPGSAVRRSITPGDVFRTAWNRLSLQLVQIKLWQAGFYEGYIDGVFGLKTLDALFSAVGHFGLNEDDACLSLGDGYFALNVRYLRIHLFPMLRSGDALETDMNDDTVIQTTVDAIRDAEAAAPSLRAPARPRDERERRSGWRRVFRSIGRFFRTVVSAVVRGVRRVADAVQRTIIKPIADAIRLAVDAARRAVRAIAISIGQFLRFVLGLPIATPREDEGDPKIVTVFQLDRDCISIVSQDAEWEDHRLHRTRIARLTAGLEFAFAVVGNAAFIAQNAVLGFYGWIRIALRLGRLLIRLARRWIGAPARDPATA